MPFNIGETIFAWTHILKGFDRRIKNHPRDRFLTEMQFHGTPITAVLYEGNPQYCQLCGYSMAELIMLEGWSMHACSALNFSKILNNAKHEQWLKTLSAAQLDKSMTAQSISSGPTKTSLPTAGV